MTHITLALVGIIIINLFFLVIKLFANLIRVKRFYEWKTKIDRMSFEERVTGFEIQYYKQVMESKYNE